MIILHLQKEKVFFQLGGVFSTSHSQSEFHKIERQKTQTQEQESSYPDISRVEILGHVLNPLILILR
jgi:hypothetical protein